MAPGCLGSPSKKTGGGRGKWLGFNKRKIVLAEKIREELDTKQS